MFNRTIYSNNLYNAIVGPDGQYLNIVSELDEVVALKEGVRVDISVILTFSNSVTLSLADIIWIKVVFYYCIFSFKC